ncbi:hypothetical protein [Pseudomonas lopnurensis]|uniref:hypothetical protein n=1 Tax=Pseudomonas lopnurensis TaxID=1477517 RepID=UPI001879C756|nr:hypothetical protein [Pseudomonas lopnurensis]MBE7375050.1 hypothetical protein [Pseudomonas lopnurensis]
MAEHVYMVALGAGVLFYGERSKLVVATLAVSACMVFFPEHSVLRGSAGSVGVKRIVMSCLAAALLLAAPMIILGSSKPTEMVVLFIAVYLAARPYGLFTIAMMQTAGVRNE